MDNVTHSLIGATLAELALPADAAPAQRRAFFAAAVVAANLPDADLLYTRITPPPLGYLLHHRGHTHTVVGLVAQGLLLALALLVPRVRRAVGPLRGRLLALVAVALASHLVLDAWNSYGVHPFWPIDARWWYGDAIYILEPWLWLLLGTAAALSTRRRGGGWTLGALLLVLGVLLVRLHQIPLRSLGILVAAGAGLVALLRTWTPRRRATFALGAALSFVAGMFGVRAQVHARAAATVPERGAFVDMILSPEPANPLCWSALAVTLDAGGATYAMTRGVVPALGGGGCGARAPDGPRWNPPVRQSIAALRDRARSDCRVRAWLQFGRAPVLAGDAIADVRYGGLARPNFSTLALAPADTACPPHLTRWGMPRGDLMGDAGGR